MNGQIPAKEASFGNFVYDGFTVRIGVNKDLKGGRWCGEPRGKIKQKLQHFWRGHFVNTNELFRGDKN